MAITLLEDATEFDGMDSSGKRSATRTMTFSYGDGDTQMDLAESELLPGLNDVHPDYTLWTVESIDKPEYFDRPPKYIVKVHYVYGGDTMSGALSGKKPWELGATNFSVNTYEKEVPLRRIYQPKGFVIGKDENGAEIRGTGKWVDFKNSAGFRKMGKDTVRIVRLTFTLNYKHKAGVILPAPLDFMFNSKPEKVCNYNIPPYAGKLLPFTTTLHTVYASNGTTVKYEYESADIAVEIMLDDTWINWTLNTGTIALWEQTIKGEYSWEDKKVMVPGATYKYREISTYNKETYADDLLKAKIKFGSLAQMIAQRQKFIKNGGTSVDFPYEEFTEEMPLKKAGTLYTDALLDPENHEYLQIGGFLREGQSWAKYNLPDKR